ncbi:chitobiase/beta-hexosaminidase C-terminal domain-containing protein [Cytobacillus sp. Hm23]
MSKLTRKRTSFVLVALLVFNLFNVGLVSQSFAAETFVETFDNSNATGSYGTDSFVGNDGVTWSYVASRDEGDYPIDGKGLMLRRSSDNSSIISSPIPDGISSFSVDLKKGFTGIGNRQVELFINGESKGLSEAFDDTDIHTFSVEELNIAEEVEIQLVNVTGKQIVIDNITWTSFDGEVTQASKVKASVSSGEVDAGTEVTLSTSTDGADIYFTTDGTLPTEESTLYDAPIAINEDVTIQAIAVKEGLDASNVASFSYTVKAPLEVQSIADTRALEVGSEAKIEGVVTASFVTGGKTNLFVQDDSAGIVVRGDIAANIGDRISAEGTMNQYYDMAQLEVDAIDVIVNNEGVPAPQFISSADLTSTTGEAVEAELVKVENVTITEVDSNGNFTGVDVNGEFKLRPQDRSLLEVGKTYDYITGVIDYNFSEYKLTPRSAIDVVEDTFSVFANPASGTIEIGSTVELTTLVEDGVIYYTVDGTDPSTASEVYNEAIEVTEDVTIKAIVVKDGETSDVAMFDYQAILPLDSLDIHDIQGVGHVSLYDGEIVKNVKGIVTHLDGSNGFFMESVEADDDIRTSEGIYVYFKNSGVKVGDLVSVTGEVEEFKPRGYDDAKDLLTTEIKGSTVTVEASNQPLPAPVVIGDDRIQPTKVIDNDAFAEFDPEEDGIDFYESLEGMRIVLDGATVVGHPKYEEVPVVVDSAVDSYRSEAGGVIISPEDFNPERLLVKLGKDMDLKTGDQFAGSITGVLSYDYSNFKLVLTEDLPEVIDGGLEREITNIEKAEDKLTVASYNVENFSAETDQEKIDKIAHSIIENLKTPDIVGLIEVQDNDGPTDSGTTDASLTYEALIAAIEAAGGPTYKYTDIAPEDKMDGGQPGGNIRVGYIYNPDRVSLVDKPAGDATTAVGYDENGLTMNPGRIDPTNEAFSNSRKSLAAEFEFNGERVVVIANHLNSKRGDGALYGSEQPVVLGSEPSRVDKSQVLNDFIDGALAVNPDANFVVLGDMNDFEFSAPLRALEGDVLTNMIEELPKEERYTYIYEGNSQVLDHILVSNNVAANTEVDIVNINTDFTEASGAASDHDPVLVQIGFAVDPIEELNNLIVDFKDGSLSAEALAPILAELVLAEEVSATDVKATIIDVILADVTDKKTVKHVETSADHIERDLAKMVTEVNKHDMSKFSKYVDKVENELEKILKKQ